MTSRNFLRFYRQQRSLSQQALADFLNVTKMAVSYWEHGKRNPSKNTKEQLARLLGVPVEEMFPNGS